MAGRPELAAMERKVRELGGDSYIMDQIADGASVGEVMEPFELSRPYFYVWLRAGGEQRELAYERAKEIKSHLLLEDGKDDLDKVGADPSSAQVSLASQRANYKRMLAGLLNRKDYGDKTGASTIVNIGELHLSALQAAGQRPVIESQPVLSLPAEITEDE